MSAHTARQSIFGAALLAGTLLCTSTRASAPPSSKASDGNWTMPAGNYASTRFSALDQINAANVGRLQVDFTFSTGVNRGHEAAPIVVGNTMYIVTPYPNILYALDLTKPGAPLKWKYEPQARAGRAGRRVLRRGQPRRGVLAAARCSSTRSTATPSRVDADDRQASSGRPSSATSTRARRITMAPLVVKGKVLVGNCGGEFGVRGWLAALDADSGKLAWKAYNTGPDKDVLIGPDFKPFYAADQGKDLGVTTLAAGSVEDRRRHRVGLDLLRPAARPDLSTAPAIPVRGIPSSVPATTSGPRGIFARDPDTGQARWFYQFSPHDLYDYDGSQREPAARPADRRRTRKVLVRPERNGYVYVIDRATGEVLSADPYRHVNSILRRRPEDAAGRSTTRRRSRKSARVMRDICPASPGAKDWNPSAFSPRTGLVYIPHINLCMD